jgi:hypothetical protein
VLIADKQGIERGTAGRRRSLDHPARCLARIFYVRVIARQRNPDSHRVILVAAQASIRPELGGQAKDRLRLRRRAEGMLAIGLAWQFPGPRLHWVQTCRADEAAIQCEKCERSECAGSKLRHRKPRTGGDHPLLARSRAFPR